MANEEKEGVSSPRPANMLNNLFDIVNDLWGETQQDAKAPQHTPQTEHDPVEVEAAPQTLPFETFWKRADETVDWTDALAHDTPSDGLTPAPLWAFYHEKAAQVLSGDLEAYAEVLRKGTPLDDFKPYTASCKITIRSADKIAVTFVPDESRLTDNAEANQRYLAGVALRCARDVFALLPVREVIVQGVQREQQLVRVTYTREDLRGIQFAFIDPAALVIRLGGAFAEPESSSPVENKSTAL